jgi:putative transposase
MDRLPVFPVWIVKVRVRSSNARQRALESFNGRFRDEFLNENWFVSLAQAKAITERWRQEYNEERPKRALAGLTPVAYAAQLSQKSCNLDPGL